MIVAVIALAVALAATTGVIVWLVAGRISAADQAADARIAQITMDSELERVRFELEATTKTLAATRARASALEEALSHEIAQAPNPDLPAADARSRVLRLAQLWSASDSSDPGGPLPADAGAAVPPQPAAGEAQADVREAGR